jgi:predicted transcriptional regulator
LLPLPRIANSLFPRSQPRSFALDSWEHKRIREGNAELEAGQGVSNERVMKWLDSWGTENELPAPK